MAERKVQYYSGPGFKLAGIIEVPSDYKEGKKRPGIILCQGPAGLKENLMPEVSKWLVGRGYVVLRFDYRGFGESEGPPRRLIPLEQVEDIRSGITLIQQQTEVDSSRIGLMGFSCVGGANVSYTAGIDTRVKCMVSVSGFGDGQRWMKSIRRYWEWQEWLRKLDEDRVNRALTGKSRYVELKEIIVRDPESEEAAIKAMEMYPELKAVSDVVSSDSAEAIINFRPETVVDKISPRAAIWIYPGNDTIVPIEESQSMYRKAGEPKKLVVLEGEVHHALYEGPGFELMMAHSMGEFDSYL